VSNVADVIGFQRRLRASSANFTNSSRRSIDRDADGMH
jgi:hypothetical protein